MRAFTLIELMIVVAIIAIIASIAIPSMLRARMAANEVATLGGLKAICTGQSLFKRNNYDFAGYKPGIPQYAPHYIYLYDFKLPTPAAGSELTMINKELARASLDAAAYGLGMTLSKNGYFYQDLTGNQTAVYDYTLNWGVAATPEAYAYGGLNTFVIRYDGIVYQRDYGSAPIILTNMHDDPTVWGYAHSE
jgi:prepilin-type N-terminal cleavage/methylation domain-containing protein